MILQDRDQAILRCCYEQQFLLLEHIEQFFFEGASSRRARERLSELEEAKLLAREDHPVLGSKKLVRLKPEGLELAKSQKGLSVPHLKKLRPATLLHDSMVTTARLALSKCWPDASFIPERAIKKDRYSEVPDGLFTFPSGNAIALELENSDKGRTRFLSLLGRWLHEPQVILVLYVVTQPDLEKAIRGYLADGPEEQPAALIHLDQLVKAGERLAWSVRGEMDLFSRGGF